MKDYNPEMHTAEHILNGALVKTFGCERAFTTHIERKKSKIDVRFDRNLTRDEIEYLNSQVNEVAKRNLEVTEEFIPVEEAAEKFNLSRLPEGTKNVRIIRIGDYDACPCIGSHVAKTSEIGEFQITTTDYKEGVLRIRFKLTARK